MPLTRRSLTSRCHPRRTFAHKKSTPWAGGAFPHAGAMQQPDSPCGPGPDPPRTCLSPTAVREGSKSALALETPDSAAQTASPELNLRAVGPSTALTLSDSPPVQRLNRILSRLPSRARWLQPPLDGLPFQNRLSITSATIITFGGQKCIPHFMGKTRYTLWPPFRVISPAQWSAALIIPRSMR